MVGLVAPSGWQRVVTVGDLRRWILRILTAETAPGLETVTVISVPALSGFLSRGFRDTWREALVFLKDFLAQDFGQDAVTVEPRGTSLTTREVSLVNFLVELANAKFRRARS